MLTESVYGGLPSPRATGTSGRRRSSAPATTATSARTAAGASSAARKVRSSFGPRFCRAGANRAADSRSLRRSPTLCQASRTRITAPSARGSRRTATGAQRSSTWGRAGQTSSTNGSASSLASCLRRARAAAALSTDTCFLPLCATSTTCATPTTCRKLGSVLAPSAPFSPTAQH